MLAKDQGLKVPLHYGYVRMAESPQSLKHHEDLIKQDLRTRASKVAHDKVSAVYLESAYKPNALPEADLADAYHTVDLRQRALSDLARIKNAELEGLPGQRSNGNEIDRVRGEFVSILQLSRLSTASAMEGQTVARYTRSIL